MMIADNAALKNPKLDKAIGQLRYGGIGVNAWAGAIYGLVSTTWGAFPGHPMEDIQSGRGVVHNTFMFDHAERSVLYAPFRVSPAPVWFPDNRNTLALGEALTAFEASPSFFRLPSVLRAALGF
jgi:hypothetical protein